MCALSGQSTVNLTFDIYTPLSASLIRTRRAYVLTNSGRWVPASPFAR